MEGKQEALEIFQERLQDQVARQDILQYRYEQNTTHLNFGNTWVHVVVELMGSLEAYAL